MKAPLLPMPCTHLVLTHTYTYIYINLHACLYKVRTYTCPISPAHEVGEVPKKLLVLVFAVEMLRLLLSQVTLLAQRDRETSFFNLLQNTLCATTEWRLLTTRVLV